MPVPLFLFQIARKTKKCPVGPGTKYKHLVRLTQLSAPAELSNNQIRKYVE